MKHTFSVLVENRAGVLSRISGLFARRAFNIESLAVGITEDPNFSRVTIVVEGTDYTVEQVEKQLNKLIDVIKVRTIHPEELISRDHLTTLMVTHNMKNAIQYGNRLIMMDSGRVVVDIRGEEKKNLSVRDLLEKFHIENDRMLLSE